MARWEGRCGCGPRCKIMPWAKLASRDTGITNLQSRRIACRRDVLSNIVKLMSARFAAVWTITSGPGALSRVVWRGIPLKARTNAFVPVHFGVFGECAAAFVIRSCSYVTMNVIVWTRAPPAPCSLHSRSFYSIIPSSFLAKDFR